MLGEEILALSKTEHIKKRSQDEETYFAMHQMLNDANAKIKMLEKQKDALVEVLQGIVDAFDWTNLAISSLVHDEQEAVCTAHATLNMYRLLR